MTFIKNITFLEVTNFAVASDSESCAIWVRIHWMIYDNCEQHDENEGGWQKIVTTTCAEQPSADNENSSEQPSADEGFGGMGFPTAAAPTTVTRAFFPTEGLQLPNAVKLDFLIAFFERVEAFFAEARSEDEDEDVVRACIRLPLEAREPSPLTACPWRLETLTGQLCTAALSFTF